jgi:hypothetical protein
MDVYMFVRFSVFVLSCVIEALRWADHGCSILQKWKQQEIIIIIIIIIIINNYHTLSRW